MTKLTISAFGVDKDTVVAQLSFDNGAPPQWKLLLPKHPDAKRLSELWDRIQKLDTIPWQRVERDKKSGVTRFVTVAVKPADPEYPVAVGAYFESRGGFVVKIDTK